MEIVKIAIKKVQPNEGQLPGVPSNPRHWTKEELDNLAASLIETPELFEMRPCIVMPHEGAFVVLGGNMRLAASKKNKAKEVPCIVCPEDTPVEKQKEYAAKDNGSFGKWDFDKLGNEWDDLPLTKWGVPAWDTEAEGEESEQEQKDDLSDKISTEYKIEVTCVNEAELEQLYNELTNNGYKCRILTL